MTTSAFHTNYQGDKSLNKKQNIKKSNGKMLNFRHVLKQNTTDTVVTFFI